MCVFLKDDVRSLKDVQAFPMGSRQRNVLNILKGEKEILVYYITLTKEKIALSDMDWASFVAATITTDVYLTKVLAPLIRLKRMDDYLPVSLPNWFRDQPSGVCVYPRRIRRTSR